MEVLIETIVYIDGFNLYFRALRGTPYKWLDVKVMCDLLLPRHDVKQIKYFTAPVKPRFNDPDGPARQQTYLRALRTIPILNIYYGHFRSYEKTLPTAKSVRRKKKVKYVTVIKTDEKGSDVNLATQLLNDAHLKRFQAAVVVSNDSDLEEPIKIVHDEQGFKMGLLNPYKHPARVLLRHVDFFKEIRKGVLANAQFPETLTDGKGTFTKPPSW